MRELTRCYACSQENCGYRQPSCTCDCHPITWSVYIVECSDGTLYTGISKDVRTRVRDHNSGKGAKYTKGRTPVTLVHTEVCGSRSTASRREYAIKKLRRPQKIALYLR